MDYDTLIRVIIRYDPLNKALPIDFIFVTELGLSQLPWKTSCYTEEFYLEQIQFEIAEVLKTTDTPSGYFDFLIGTQTKGGFIETDYGRENTAHTEITIIDSNVYNDINTIEEIHNYCIIKDQYGDEESTTKSSKEIEKAIKAIEELRWKEKEKKSFQ